MIHLQLDDLVFTFPDVHPDARLEINFQRTLRIPDDGREYPLPPGLDRFPLVHVDDYPEVMPPAWLTHGGVMLPMYQSEAMWLDFNSYPIDGRRTSYPFAVKVATGKICAVSGETWRNDLSRTPRQNYLAIPSQPWLDGYCVGEGIIRQFVAVPLGAGVTAEEQLTGAAVHGGLQLLVAPMKRDVFERRFPKRDDVQVRYRIACEARADSHPDMGLAPGGKMRQKICRDPFDPADYDTDHASRCFVHIANSMLWQSMFNDAPPSPPPTAADYTRRGLPWFEYYDEKASALDGASPLAGLTSVARFDEANGTALLPENQSVDPTNITILRRNMGFEQVREGKF